MIFQPRGFCLPRIIVVGFLVLSLAATACADPKPLSKEEQAKVDKAIEKGVAYLKKVQTKDGTWPGRWGKMYLLGHCALPGYALLEAGVPPNDPVIKQAAEYLRSKIVENDVTYELSLAILFFDRLGDPKDKKLIQTCALRLIAGQHRSGGWSYRCPNLRGEDLDKFEKLLTELNNVYESGKKPTLKTLSKLEVPDSLKPLTVFQDRRSLVWRELWQIEGRRHSGFTLETDDIPGNHLMVIPTDNSNTQFAMLGLWAAQRQGIPVCPTFDLMVERFERTQRVDGSWPYNVVDNVTPSMICVGLMGLAIGRGMKLTSSSRRADQEVDHRVLKGLAALYKKIGIPSGQMEKRVSLQDVYFLWSVERVAMLYDLPTLGNKEWYRWGAESLVVNQKEEGDWGAAVIPGSKSSSDCGSALNTAFALLFLKHSHPMKDLTPKLPVTGMELTRGIARVLRDPRILEGTTSDRSRNTEPDR